MPPAIIFDLDGTLIDSVPDIHASVNQAFAPFGAAPFSRAEIQHFVGRGAPNLIQRASEARGLPTEGPEHDRLLAEFLEIYEGAQALTTLYPGVETALETLQRQGLRLGICTNKPLAPTRAVLAHFGLDRFFPVVIGGDSLAVKKPDPAPLLKAMVRLGGGPMIFVGDSEVDAETAKNAEVPFLLYTEGYRKGPVDQMYHTATFDDFLTLPRLVAAVSASAAP